MTMHYYLHYLKSWPHVHYSTDNYRLAKEAAYYKKEVQENETKLAKMKEDNKDPYDIKKFAEVLDESIMMVPDSENRLKKALEDLELFLSSNDGDLKDEEWITRAKTLVETHA